MTMAAGPVSLEHHVHRTSSFDNPIVGMSVNEKENLRLNGDKSPSIRERSNNVQGEDSDEDAGADEEEDHEKAELSPDISKPRVRKKINGEADDITINDDDDEEEEEEEEGDGEEESSAVEGSEESEESYSDSEVEEVPGYDAVSEAAETAASAEVQTRNNCV